MQWILKKIKNCKGGHVATIVDWFTKSTILCPWFELKFLFPSFIFSDKRTYAGQSYETDWKTINRLTCAIWLNPRPSKNEFK